MVELSCEQCRDLAAEFALGVLEECESSEMQAHLEHCARCRDIVDSLAATATRLVALLPEADSPPGFVERVLAVTARGRSPRT